MSRKQILVFVLILAAFVVSYLLLSRSSLSSQSASDPYEISVICRGPDTESWTAIQLGIDQAAQDFNVDISFITLSSINDVSEQISLLNREVDNGADAVVIAPVDSANVGAAVETAAKTVPTVFLQSTVTGVTDVRTISCDYALMGQNLANTLMAQRGISKDVVIFRNNMDCSNVAESYQSVAATLKKSGFSVSDFNIPDNSSSAYSTIRKEIASRPSSTFVALDGETLETVATAKKDLEKTQKVNASIYGIGRTNTVVSLLEDGTIHTIGVENEYSMGYLCIKAAVDSLHHKANGNTNVNFIIVNSSDMYQSENEHILFPFVR